MIFLHCTKLFISLRNQRIGFPFRFIQKFMSRDSSQFFFECHHMSLNLLFSEVSFDKDFLFYEIIIFSLILHLQIYFHNESQIKMNKAY